MESMILLRTQPRRNRELWIKKVLISIAFIAIFASVSVSWNDIASGTGDAKYLYFSLTIATVLLCISGYKIYSAEPVIIVEGIGTIQSYNGTITGSYNPTTHESVVNPEWGGN